MSLLRSLRPFLFPAVLLGIAVITGGAPGVIAGSFAVLLAIDRLLDRAVSFTGWGMFDAERRYLRLARARRFERRVRRLRRLPPEQLAYLAEDAGWAAVAQRRRLGVQPIAVDSVVGTVDRQKAAAFDHRFRPPAWGRTRWTQMAYAVAAGTRLPPVSVYRVGDEHFVRDGHHRVSVARALGADAIEAEVTELTAPGPEGDPGRHEPGVTFRPSAASR